jgi:hypothetical protein
VVRLPIIKEKARVMGDGTKVISYTDTVGTAYVTYTYEKEQERFMIYNKGLKPIIYTVGTSVDVQVLPGESSTVQTSFTSFQVKSSSGVQQFLVETDETGDEFGDVEVKKLNDRIEVWQGNINPIYGVFWTKGSDPVMQRTNDAVNMKAAVGTDGQMVWNDFDDASIYREISEVTDALGNVFVRIPKFYIRKKDGAGFKSWQISKTKYPGFYLPWCFWDFTNNKELPHIDVGKYKATLGAGNKLESKPNLYPLVSRHIVDFRTFARNNNVGGLKGYQQLDVHVVDVLQTLFYVEFATLNPQSIMQGYTTGQYTSTHTAVIAENNVNRIIVPNATADLYRVGQPISVGTTQGGNQVFYGRTITAITVYDASNKAISFDGTPVNIAVGNMLYNTGWKNGFSSAIAASSGSVVSNSDGKYPCVYRGIESPWGDVWQFVDGMNINEYQAWIAKNADDYASNVFASPYEQLGYVNANANGYPIEMGYDANYPYAALPKTIGGSSNTYYSDYYYQNTGQRIALFGAGWYYGPSAGVSCWDLGASSGFAYVYIGGRLIKKPL